MGVAVTHLVYGPTHKEAAKCVRRREVTRNLFIGLDIQRTRAAAYPYGHGAVGVVLAHR